jgi:cytochrome b6-f complex iron-sulfur subunit
MKKLQHKKAPTSDKKTLAEPLSRRDFFNKAWKWLGIIAAIEVVAMFGGFLFTGKSKIKSAPKRLLEAGPVDSFEKNSVSAFMGGRFYLARQKDGGFIALSLRCTHLGCSIAWEKAQNRFICPCHSSAFAISGEVLNPPAARALDYYPVLIENGIVKVDIGTIVERSNFRKDQLQYA